LQGPINLEGDDRAVRPSTPAAGIRSGFSIFFSKRTFSVGISDILSLPDKGVGERAREETLVCGSPRFAEGLKDFSPHHHGNPVLHNFQLRLSPAVQESYTSFFFSVETICACTTPGEAKYDADCDIVFPLPNRSSSLWSLSGGPSSANRQ